MIQFVLMVNKQGQTRLASYFSWYPLQERAVFEAEIIRRCLSRTEFQCSFLEYRGLKIIYRRYASLFFVVAVDGDEEVRVCVSVQSFLFLITILVVSAQQNELAILEFIHSLVETMDKYFESVCELDVRGFPFFLVDVGLICSFCLPRSCFTSRRRTTL